jgi:TrmH family RNA methyltransferase
VHRQETVDRYRSARSDPGLAVLEGFHALKHALRFGAEIVEAVSPDVDHVLALADELAPDVREAMAATLEPIPSRLYGELSPRPPDSGAIALARRPAIRPETILADPSDVPAVFLEAPSHLGNLGAAVRVAAAAGAAGVLATGEHDPWHASALRGSAGLHFAVPVAAVPGVPETDRPLVAVDPGGEPLQPGVLPARPLLAFGSERRGLAPPTLERADLSVRIPMREGVSSLNLATSVAVVLYASRMNR